MKRSGTKTIAECGGIAVVVTQSVEHIDFDLWAARYVRLVIAAHRRPTQDFEAA